MLEIRNLQKSFDGLKAVDDLAVSVQSRRITSLIGPNGAGKTTVFNIATGYLDEDDGDILFAGGSLLKLQPWQIAQRGISRTFQNLRLFRQLSVQENVLLGIHGQNGERFLNALVSFSPASKEHRENVERAHELIEFVGLREHLNELAENLSYGQQKLLSIACCLAGDPKLLLLDEPVAGVQPQMAERIASILKQLVRDGKTVLLIEHDIDFVLKISDFVVVMDHGKKVIEGPPSVIQKSPEILEAYLS